MYKFAVFFNIFTVGMRCQFSTRRMLLQQCQRDLVYRADSSEFGEQFLLFELFESCNFTRRSIFSPFLELLN